MNKENLINIDLVQDNNWLDAYLNLINLNLNTTKKAGLTQRHHIIPRYYFYDNNLVVDDSENNIVNLTIKDHILAHYYLCRYSTDKYKGKNYASINYILRNQSIDYLPGYEEFVSLLNNIDEYYKEYRELINRLSHSEDAKQKLSQSLKNFYANLDKESERWLERNKKISESKKGWSPSQETRQKMSENAKLRTGKKNPFFGKHHAEETKKVIASKNSKKVIARDIYGVEHIFSSIKEAKEWINTAYDINISYRRIKNASKTDNMLLGFTWTIIDNGHKKSTLSEESRAKLAASAIKARGQKVTMDQDGTLITFDSLNKAAKYILDNNLDHTHYRTVGQKIKNAALNNEKLYNCKWKLI